MPRESYFITPKRLMNPLFWKTVDLLHTVSPEFTIVLPQATYKWLYNNWNKISPENASICLEYADRYLSYGWSTDTVAAGKVLTSCIERKNYSDSLDNSCVPEDVLTKFIKGTLIGMIEKIDPKKSRYRNHVDELNKVLSNNNIKTYQIEFIWHNTPKPIRPNMVIELSYVRKYEVIPDYLFLKILRVAVIQDNDMYDREKVFREAIKRNMLKIVKPPAVTVTSTRGVKKCAEILKTIRYQV